MLKIVAYCGSPKGIKSNTYNVILKLIEFLREKNRIEFEIFSPYNSNILRCKGCTNCFKYGYCLFKKKDDMETIKRKMLSADAIILGTPIYAGNVTADFKAFLDRISYWTHLMRLCGKPTLCIMTSCGNGVHFTKTYLSSMMVFLGSTSVVCENIITYSLQDIENNENLKILKAMAKNLNDTLSNIPVVSEASEIVFNNLKKRMQLYKVEPSFEYLYWKKNGFFKMDSFKEVIARRNTIIEPLILL